MTPKPYPGWLSMEPDRANLELRPDAEPTPPEPRRAGCSLFPVVLLLAVAWWRGQG